MALPLLERIESFLRGARPNAYCAKCLAQSLELTDLYGDPETLLPYAMASLPKASFATATRHCSLCGERKVTVWAATTTPSR